MKALNFLFGILVFTGLITVETNAQKASEFYKIANRFKLPGDAGWDYLKADDASGRLFVSHGEMVQVVEMSSGKLLGTIPDTKGVHGITLAQGLNKGFISCGRDSSVKVFDLNTLEVLSTVKVTGSNPDAILYDEFSQKVFTFNGRSSNSTVIDAKTGQVLATIPLAGKPEFAVTDGKGKVFVNIEDQNLIAVINSQALSVENQWPIKPGEGASGLAFDRQTHRLFAVCDNQLMVIMDSQNGEVVTTVPIGKNVDGAAFDPLLKRAYSSNGEGTLTVVQEENGNNFKVMTTVPTQKGARTITLSEKTHHLYLPTAKYGTAPAATKENPRPRPPILPGTFTVLDIEPVK
jgi:YVTN family beta-propeller protein